ncbi:MAG: lysozyme inhibitor LprI family protein [Acidobacteriota bacterium]
MRVLGSATLIILCVLMIAANPAQKRKAKDPCSHAQATADIIECEEREYNRADAELNRVYRQLVSKLADEGHKVALKKAQQAWIKYRAANCEYKSYQSQDMRLYPAVSTRCLAWMIKERTNELRQMLKEN